MDLNCSHPLISRCFSVVNTPVLQDPWLVESRDVKPWMLGATVKLRVDFVRKGVVPGTPTSVLFRGLLYSHLSKLSPQCIITIFLPLSKNVFKLEKASYESNAILVNLSILH